MPISNYNSVHPGPGTDMSNHLPREHRSEGRDGSKTKSSNKPPRVGWVQYEAKYVTERDSITKYLKSVGKKKHYYVVFVVNCTYSGSLVSVSKSKCYAKKIDQFAKFYPFFSVVAGWQPLSPVSPLLLGRV
jgi:hypothetical protein